MEWPRDLIGIGALELKSHINQTALEIHATEAPGEFIWNTDLVGIKTLELNSLIIQTATEILVAEARMESSRNTGLVEIGTLELKNTPQRRAPRLRTWPQPSGSACRERGCASLLACLCRTTMIPFELVLRCCIVQLN